LGASGAALLAGVGCAQRTPPTAVDYFSGRVSDWTREILADDPELAASAGVSVDDAGGPFKDRLQDRSAAATERRRAAAERRAVELRGIDAAGLEGEQAATYRILATQFADAAELARFDFGRFDPIGGASPYVISQGAGAYLDLPSFFDTQHAIASFEDADAYLSRLEQVPAALDAEVERMRADAAAGVIPPDFIVARSLQLARQALSTPPEATLYLSGLAEKLDALTPQAAPGEPLTPDQRRRQRLENRAYGVVRDRIVAAYQRTAIALGEIAPRARTDAGVWSLPDGEAYYAALLKSETTTTLSPAEIHEIGLETTRALTAELDTALRRQGLTQGGVGERMAILTADPAHTYPNTPEGHAALIADVRARVARAMELAPRWFATMPRAALEVEPVPALAQDGAPGAYYSPPPVDGSRPGIYYINLRDTAEMTKIDLPTQDYHEAAPGHHFQIAIALEQTDLPLLRRLMGFGAYVEGWAVYAEQLADEQRLFDDDPIGRLGYLRWRLWRSARLVADTGLHALRWTKAQTQAFLQETLGDHPAVIETEVERYAATPGQACSYELGRREIVRQRDAARRELGAQFALPGFHDAVLKGGPAPLGEVETRVRAWIESRRA
jgi:uncharacterized protein (DUF885 family)